MQSLPYGSGSLQVPSLWTGRGSVLAPGPFPETEPAQVVTDALDHPVGGPVIEDVCTPGTRLACVIPDLTRRAAVSHYLPVLLGRLADAGIAPRDVTVVVALGIHRPLTADELRGLVGEEVFRKYEVKNHDADSRSSNVRIGVTSAGIPVEINRQVAEAEHVILTGGLTYHYFAGYGGGRKSLLPGVASRKSCEEHHRLVVAWRRGLLEGVLEPGVLDGNPAHEQMIQACSFLPSLYVLNVVTEPAGRIVAASAGGLDEAHRAACRKHDSYFRLQMDQSFDLVIAGSGGAPKDVNFVQAHKSLYAAHRAVSPSGVVILAAQCSEGTGHPDLLSWFGKCRTLDQWLEELEAAYQINGQTAMSTWLRTKSVPTIFVSRLNKRDVEMMGMIPAKDMYDALGAAEGILGWLPAPLIVPDAGDVLPVIKRKESSVQCPVDQA